MADFSQMKISELIEFAERQAKIEQENPPAMDPDQNASWTATLEVLRWMKEHGVPERLRDERRGKAKNFEGQAHEVL